MLIENTLFGERDKVKIAIDRLIAFEPPEGYQLAFSGGKDSLCIYHLALESGVKFHAYYNYTTVDPPELIYFIRRNFPDITMNYPDITMWDLIVKHGIPPTRRVRYCCEKFKERIPQKNGIIITGVRWDESIRRKKARGLLEVQQKKRKSMILMNDNEDNRLMFETCLTKGFKFVNPIIDWEEEDVWQYIHLRGLEYCHLYDCGFKRIGCIGCPLAGYRQMNWELNQYPKFKNAYIRAFDRMVTERKEKNLYSIWSNGVHVMDWWLGKVRISPKDQLTLDELIKIEGTK